MLTGRWIAAASSVALALGASSADAGCRCARLGARSQVQGGVSDGQAGATRRYGGSAGVGAGGRALQLDVVTSATGNSNSISGSTGPISETQTSGPVYAGGGWGERAGSVGTSGTPASGSGGGLVNVGQNGSGLVNIGAGSAAGGLVNVGGGVPGSGLVNVGSGAPAAGLVSVGSGAPAGGLVNVGAGPSDGGLVNVGGTGGLVNVGGSGGSLVNVGAGTTPTGSGRLPRGALTHAIYGGPSPGLEPPTAGSVQLCPACVASFNGGVGG